VYKTESYACKTSKYQENPAAVIRTTGNLSTSEQALLVGPRYATALGSRTAMGGREVISVLSTTPPLSGGATESRGKQREGKEGGVALELAVRDTSWALQAWACTEVLALHRAEWHRFYESASFVVRRPRPPAPNRLPA
jgi:hypothetical protein